MRYLRICLALSGVALDIAAELTGHISMSFGVPIACIFGALTTLGNLPERNA